MKSANTVVITGVSGHVGLAISEEFIRRGWQVIGTSRENRLLPFPVIKVEYKSYDLTKVLNKFNPKLLIHAAGSADVQKSIIAPKDDFNGSVELFRELLKNVRRANIPPKIVYISSAAVYGNPSKFPIDEKSDINPISPYGRNKVNCEQLAYKFSHLHSIPTLIVRLFSTFGPKQHRLLVWEIFNQINNNKQIIIKGTGNEQRDYLHIKDLSSILFDFIQSGFRKYEIINIASGISYPVREMANRILKIMNKKVPIKYSGMKLEGNPTTWVVDVSKLEARIRHKIPRDIDSRLKECILEWQKK